MTDDELIEAIVALKGKVNSKERFGLGDNLNAATTILRGLGSLNTIEFVTEPKDGLAEQEIKTTDRKVCKCTHLVGAPPVTIVVPVQPVGVTRDGGNTGPYKAQLLLTKPVPVNGTATVVVSLEWPEGKKGAQGQAAKVPVPDGVTFFDDEHTRVKSKVGKKGVAKPSFTGVSASITGASIGVTGTNVSLGVFDHVFRGFQIGGGCISDSCTLNTMKFRTTKGAKAAAKSCLAFWKTATWLKEGKRAVVVAKG